MLERQQCRDFRMFCRRLAVTSVGALKSVRYRQAPSVLAHLAAQTKAGHKDTATFRLLR